MRARIQTVVDPAGRPLSPPLLFYAYGAVTAASALPGTLTGQHGLQLQSPYGESLLQL